MRLTALVATGAFASTLPSAASLEHCTRVTPTRVVRAIQEAAEDERAVPSTPPPTIPDDWIFWMPPLSFDDDFEVRQLQAVRNR